MVYVRHVTVRATAFLAALFSAIGVARSQPGGSGPPPARVVLDAARMETMEQHREVTGELQPVRRTLLASQEDGWVVEFTAREGDLVEAGQVLARLDDKLAGLDVQRVEAVVKKWRALIVEYQADLDKRERDVQKLKVAMERGSATETEIADAETLAATSRARLDQADAELAAGEAELGLANKRLDDMVIRSPLRGRVASKRTEVGQWLKRGDAVIELVQLDPIEAWLDVPEAVVTRLQGTRTPGSGQGTTGGAKPAPVQVQIRLPALDQVRAGKVAAILPRADSLSRLVPVRVTLENTDELLRPGMSITGLVPAGTLEPQLTIHKDALLRNDSGAYVYFSAGGVAQIARVEVKFGAGDRLAIRSEQLKPGMDVVVEGNERLFPGQPLTPVPPRGGTRAAPAGAAPKPETDAPRPPPGAGADGARGTGEGTR